ncbi:transmembrane protein, putative (macronuclear) [Tetrahymena thermophila SB210]|uniref:Transmembrane protein, putative n=1 Tax=Tetrahymena thermophila (strain SB210) TaxID=312017 RepID=Q23UE7_TETTS|nr:transmembrane protein, putative [Tetrahymena thermophila SB210]EAS00118.2 transmembrane protein, putative [Tetrahymena thermophila SB210]|eukprot:XP_001020363.2 transmembrane protein, putative [Tetrahymena thermophila SB210]
MVMDQRNQMSIINNNFQIILQNVQQYGILVDVKMYEPDIFFTLFYSSQSNLAYPCQFGFLEITQNGVIQRPITYTVVSIKFSIVRKITDDNSQEIFLFNDVLAYSYSLTQQIKWYKQSGIQLRGNQNYIIGETITSEIINIQNTISYVGAASGYLGVSPLNQDYPIQKVYSIQKMYSQDTIQFIKRSFKLGSYYVIKISSIQIFNLFSNELIGQINFDLKISTNPDSFENIVDLYISDNLGIFLSFNRQQIIVKDQINNLNYTIKQSQISNSLNQVQGCWIDETYSKILAYGKILVEFNLDLSNMNILSPAGHFNYEICFFMEQFVVCKLNTNSISIYDKLQQYKVQASILIQTLTLMNFNLQIDQKLQYIFAYENQIEIYNFQGNYLSSINGSNQPIFQFDICSSYLLAYTPSGKQISIFQKFFLFYQNFLFFVLFNYLYKLEVQFFRSIYGIIRIMSLNLKFSFFIQKQFLFKLAAMIISRQTLQIVKNIIPSIGQLRKGFYFPQINLIAYQTNEITTGQLKFFSLNTLQSQGSITQPYKYNGIGNSLGAKYDQENNMIFYVDTYGNSQIVTLGSTVSNQNIIGISELQLQQTAPPIDYFLDFDMNEIFIHNGQYIWRQSYNILTKVYQTVDRTEKQFYILIQSQANSFLNSILVCDNSYNLFLYDQQKMVFIQRFQDQVIDMKKFVQFNQVINLVVFSSQVDIIIGQTISLIPNINNISYTLSYKIKQFLLVGENIAIFLTQNNQFIDYDFVNQKQFFTYQFNQNYLIVTTFNFTYLDNQNQKQNILLVSLVSGEVFQYNINQKQSQIIGIYQPSNIVVQFIQKDNSQLVLIMSQGNIIQVDINSMKATNSQIFNQKAQSINQSQNQSKGSNLILFDIDYKYQRYYLSIAEEKKLAVFNLINNNLIKYLSFPELYWKQLYNTESYLVLGCKFQLNFYNITNLSYIGRFRKSSLSFSMKQFLSINEKCFAISYQNGIEIILINTQNQIQSVHFKQLSFPEIISLNNVINNQIYQILAITSTGIYEYLLSLGQISDQIANYNSNQSNCIQEIRYQNNALTQNQLDQISQANIPNNLNQIIKISIDQEINFSNFQSNNQTQFIFQSVNSTNSNLVLSQNSFLNINQDVNLIDLNLHFQQGQQLIQFNQKTQNINFQSLQISNQSISYGSQLLFNSTNSVQLVDMKFMNLNLSSSQRLLDSNIGQQTQLGLFVFKNISYVLIDKINIDNMFQFDDNFALIIAQQIGTLIIKNLYISNSFFNGILIQLMDIQNLKLETIIIKNCQNTAQKISQLNQSIILELLGIQQTLINNLISTQNKELTIIRSNKTYSSQNYIRNLFDDSFILQNAFVSKNQFPITYELKKQQNLFLISNTNIILSSIQFQQNEGNILIKDSTQININQSNFQLNKGTDGASFYFKDIKNISINSTQFIQNEVFGNGGSLLFEDVQIINIDSKSQFLKNTALIGGAIRIISSQNNLLNLNAYGLIQATFQDNIGKIYGNNIGTYPIKLSILNNQQKEIFQANLFEKELSNILYITDQQSGGNLYLSIRLYDNENKIVAINLNQIQSNNYPESIMNELQFYVFELFDTSGRVDIRGQSIITYKQFYIESFSFVFDNIILAAQPNIVVSSQSLKIKLTQQQIVKNVNMQIKFRNCLPGEVFLQISDNIIQCEQCIEGTYSLQQPILNNLQETDSLKCKKCPFGVSKCYSNKLVLSNGFWRENEETDLILQCNQEYPNICNSQDKDSLNGCIQGYLGPLCETCDIFGKVWKNGYYANSIQKYKCQKCSESNMEFVYIFLIAIFIFSYILANILMLMKNCIANAHGNYLRMMKLLPYSKSCIQDESVFIMKILLNFIQISSIVYSFKVSIIPQMVTYIFEFFGTPAQKLSASSECFYHYLNLSQNKNDNSIYIKLTSMLYLTIPFLFYLTQLIVLNIIKRIKKIQIKIGFNYIITHITFFFFQFDVLNYFISTFQCRQIGSKSYLSPSLELFCDDQDFQLFNQIYIIPIMAFWILFPLILLILFLKDSKVYKNRNSLNYFIIKSKYGYFFLEFKQNYYFWEFVRIYFKISIILTSVLLQQQQEVSSICPLIIIIIYTQLLLVFKPFYNNQLNYYETISCFTLIFNIFIYQIYQIYQLPFIETIIIIFYFGYVISLIFIIFKINLNQQKNTLFKHLRNCLKNCLPKYLKNQIVQKKYNKLKTLKLWKKASASIKNIKLNKINSEISKFQDHLKEGDQMCLQADQTQIMQRKRSITNAKKQSYILSNILHVNEKSTVRNKRQSIYNMLQNYQKALCHENQTKQHTKNEQDKSLKFNFIDEEIKDSNDLKASQKQSQNLFDLQSELSEYSKNQIYTINSVKQHSAMFNF